MTSIRKQLLVGGNPHFVEVNSSLDLEEVEITGTDPNTGKTVHISLSSLLKQPRYPEPSPYSPQPLGMGSPGPAYGSTSSPPSLLDLNMPSPSALTANASAPSGGAMDMFSEGSPNITPPLSNETTLVPAAPAGLMGLPDYSTPSAPASSPASESQEVIAAREPQGLEALDDPLPSIMENASDEVVVEPTRTLHPSLKRVEADLDDTISSMYRH